jgi:hypothetical protein
MRRPLTLPSPAAARAPIARLARAARFTYRPRSPSPTELYASSSSVIEVSLGSGQIKKVLMS